MEAMTLGDIEQALLPVRQELYSASPMTAHDGYCGYGPTADARAMLLFRSRESIAEFNRDFRAGTMPTKLTGVLKNLRPILAVHRRGLTPHEIVASLT